MKAAVIYNGDEFAHYVDFPEPRVQNDGQLLVTVKAVAIKHVDRSRAAGKHYASPTVTLPAKVPGGDGVGLLADGTRVFAMGVEGMMAEKALVEKSTIVKLPEGIDNAIAAALPNAVAGSAMGLRFRAGMQGGETVLINGATGFTGRVAVQLARHYGAKRIIVTGRNEQSLDLLLTLGADEKISLNHGDDQIIEQLKKIHHSTPVDIIIDYLWGHTAELILASLKGNGSFTHQTRFVSIGAMAGDSIRLSAENLRSVDLQLCGSGLGSWKKEEIQKLFSEIIPEAFQLVVDKKLVVETETISLDKIGEIWDKVLPDGRRLVVTI